jgi:uncharacterized protein YndB with AHSA1/START domain
MQEIARIQIDASPQAVFDLIAENTRRGEWAEGMETFDYTSDFDPNDAVGTSFTQRIREGRRVTEYHGEITAYDPPKAWGAKTVGGSYSMVVEYHLTAANGGTKVVNVVEVDSSSVFVRVMGFLFSWFTKWLGRKQLRKLKELVEAA